jgi:predicted ribosome quality control (RQC) complex YloA/Tae2 family protein
VDNLVLIRVAAAIGEGFSGAVLRDVRMEGLHRWRLVFEQNARGVSLIVSLRPELPWIGRPMGRWEGSSQSRGPFGALLLRALGGRVLARAEKATADRVVTFSFGDGGALVAELATHGANLILLDGAGRVLASVRKPRSAQARVAVGEVYERPTLPGRLLDPFAEAPSSVDALLERRMREGESRFEALRRGVFGVGTEGARLLVAESRGAGRTVGQLLAERLSELREGKKEPVVLAREDPWGASRAGELDLTRLLPWDPAELPPGTKPFRRADPAGTAGLYHEAVERTGLIRERGRALLALLGRELERLAAARRQVSADLITFEEPERFRRWGEALLAGLSRARVVGDAAIVTDPYDPEQGDIAVPIKPGRSLQDAADSHFRRHRRALRGRAQARLRAAALARRAERLESLQLRSGEGLNGGAVAELEREMRAAGIPVALEPPTRSGKAAALGRKPRLEGVRLLTSSDGLQILVGRSGRHNHRLTFELAAPDDFWFHAKGLPGAHVVVRNDVRRPRPPAATLHQAAAVAAWYSDARRQPWAEVQWTRRKYVRRPRGAPPGTVVLKRFETLRVRPALPSSARGPAAD